MSPDLWHDIVGKSTNCAGELDWQTNEGFSLRPIYWPGDGPRYPPIRTPDRGPILRQDLDVSDIGVANRQARAALSGGCDSVYFDIGRTRHPLNKKHFEKLIAGISSKNISMHFSAGISTPAAYAMWLDSVESVGGDLSLLKGSLDWDPFRMRVSRGLTVGETDLDVTADLVRWCIDKTPKVRCVTIDSTFFQECGATVTQQLALSLAAACDLLARLGDRTISPEALAKLFHFTVSVGVSYFIGISALRALRLLLSQLFSAYLSDDRPVPTAFIHASTSRWHDTLCAPTTNFLRHTTEAAAAYIGGCDSLSIGPIKPGMEDDTSLRIARNIALILRHESYLDRVGDPSAGSYYVETMTDLLTEGAWYLFQEIEKRGGLIEALRTGWVQKIILDARAISDEQIGRAEQVFLGTNLFPDPSEVCGPNMRPRHEMHSVDSPLSSSSLNSDWQIKSLKRACKEGASLEQMCSDYPPHDSSSIAPLDTYRATEEFEDMRYEYALLSKERETGLTVHLVNIGNAQQRATAEEFVKGFFSCAGIEITSRYGFDSIPDKFNVNDQDPPVSMIVVCCADEHRIKLTSARRRELKHLVPKGLLIFADPDDLQDPSLSFTGFEAIIQRSSPLLKTLKDILKSIT